MTKDKHLTVTEASAYTGLSRRTIQRYVASGKLPSIKDEAGVRQIPVEKLRTYAQITSNRNRDDLTGILLEILELLPTSNITALAKKQAIRERIRKVKFKES